MIVEAVLELDRRFGAVSSVKRKPFADFGANKGQSYRDDLVRVFIDVPDLPESHQFFLEFKERIKAKFQQIDIWMTSYPVEVL